VQSQKTLNGTVDDGGTNVWMATIGYEASGIWFHLFLLYPMSLGIRESACWQGTGFRSMVDEGRSG